MVSKKGKPAIKTKAGNKSDNVLPLDRRRTTPFDKKNHFKKHIDLVRPFVKKRVMVSLTNKNRFISLRDADEEFVKIIPEWDKVFLPHRRWIVKILFIEMGLEQWSGAKSQNYFILDSVYERYGKKPPQ